MTGRIRGCVACGQQDDHPRHVIAAVAVAGAKTVDFHMDCHASMGCETCRAQISGADGAQGDELRTHLITLGEAHNG